MSYWGFPRYVPVAEKKAKAQRNRDKLLKKNLDLKPVLLAGKTIARTWWGKSWNENLERYADYSNRIGRGRSYVRHGAVLDLQIAPGEVKTLVQGSQSKPYSIVIRIKSIPKDIWKRIKAACEGKLESMHELLMGEFPKTLGEIFMEKGAGLFPAPKEIEFSCSCPDWASMCKHVAASLYGVGARLDEDPSLFFKLRNANIGDLAAQAVEDRTKKLLKKAETKSARVLEDSGLSELFGIEMEEETVFRKTGTNPEKTEAKVEKKIISRRKPKTSKPKSKVKKATRKSAGKFASGIAKKADEKSAKKKTRKTAVKKGGRKKMKS
ncbi:MAG: hypothetical protein HZA01_04515 [Nitrospinae bacterium]|nr:hypothetical protein [Nitrospinota bacterium]